MVQELELNHDVRASASGNSLILSAFEPAHLERIVELVKELDVPQDNAPEFGGFLSQLSGNRGAADVRLNPKGHSFKVEGFDVANATGQWVPAVGFGDRLKAFRAKQAYLRKQIELQREKLKLLERRLEQREKAAGTYFRDTKSETPENKIEAPKDSGKSNGLFGATQIELVPETDAIVIRGHKKDVQRVTGDRGRNRKEGGRIGAGRPAVNIR